MDADTYYREHYSDVACSGIVGVVSRFIHRSLERNRTGLWSNRSDLERVLEVGAGGGQHSKYVKHSFSEMKLCDLRPENIPSDFGDERIQKIAAPIDAQRLPFATNSFDRIIATCLLAHLTDPEAALVEWRRVVRKDGVISIYLPCEPGLFLRFAQSLTTRRRQRKLGPLATLFHYREHRNHYPGLLAFIAHVFQDDFTIRKYPFPFLGWNFNIWSVVQVNLHSKNSE